VAPRVRVLELRSVYGTGGGPEKTILAGAKPLDPDIDLTVCYLRLRGDDTFSIGDRAASLGVDYVEVSERHSLDPAIWPALRRIVRDRRIDVVHAHEYKTDLLAWLLAKRERVVPLATAHGWTGHSWKERRIYYPGDKRVLARYPKVIAVSSEIKRTLVAAGARPERVEVVLNAIDVDRFRRRPDAEGASRGHYGLAPGDTVIGAVGRLEPQKRFDLLIEAIGALAPQHPSLRLLIAGDGSLREALDAQIARAGLGGRVRLIGHEPDIMRFHHALDLFVQSSDYEGTPNVVLEAMALGTPVVATDVGGTAELCRADVDGLILAPGSAPRLADAIRRALADPAATRERAAVARRHTEDELSFNRRLARVEAIYKELAFAQRLFRARA
jgi:glycosyltransferase involved in cell wall biosynthesis